MREAGEAWAAMISIERRASRTLSRILGGMETAVRPVPRAAVAVIDRQTAPRLAVAIAGAWDARAEPGGEPEPASRAETRDSRTARGVAAVAGVLAVAAALAIAARATESSERAAHPGRTRGWFWGAPALAGPMSGPADGRNPGRGEQDMRSLVTAGAALAIGAAAQAQVGEPVQWRVEDGGNGHWYAVKTWGQKTSWETAKLHAESIGGHLATITTSSEDAWTTQLTMDWTGAWFGITGPWIGATATCVCLDGNACFSWVTGEAFEYSRWHPGNPDNVTTPG